MHEGIVYDVISYFLIGLGSKADAAQQNFQIFCFFNFIFCFFFGQGPHGTVVFSGRPYNFLIFLYMLSLSITQLKQFLIQQCRAHKGPTSNFILTFIVTPSSPHPHLLLTSSSPHPHLHPHLHPHPILTSSSPHPHHTYIHIHTHTYAYIHIQIQTHT